MPQEPPCVLRIIYDRHFLIKLIQFEKKKLDQLVIFFILLGNLNIKIYFRN